MKLNKKIVMSAVILISACLPCYSQNLLQNASFEDGEPNQEGAAILTGWNVRDLEDIISFHSISMEKAQDGVRSAKIDIPDGKKTVCYFAPPQIKAEGGKNYRLTFYALYPDAKTGGTASATVSRLTAEKKFAGEAGVKTVKITTFPDWKKYTLEYQMPADKNSYYIVIQLQLEGSGKIWFDNVSFEEIATNQK